MAHASFYLFPTHATDKKENNIAVTMMNASMQQELSRRRLRARFLPIVGREELRRLLRDPVAFPFPFQHGVDGVDEMSKALKDHYASPMKGYGCVPDASRQSSHLDATFTNAKKVQHAECNGIRTAIQLNVQQRILQPSNVRASAR